MAIIRRMRHNRSSRRFFAGAALRDEPFLISQDWFDKRHAQWRSAEQCGSSGLCEIPDSQCQSSN